MSYSSAQIAAVEREASATDVIGKRLSELFASLKNTAETLNQTKARLFGASPGAPEKAGPAAVPLGTFGAINEQIDSLNAIARDLNDLANSLTRT